MELYQAVSDIKLRLGDCDITDDVVTLYLQDAKDAIMQRLYPFGVPQSAEFPQEYETMSCKLAVRYISRRGAEGENTHNENGINRSYANVDDDDLLSVVTPYVKV